MSSQAQTTASPLRDARQEGIITPPHSNVDSYPNLVLPILNHGWTCFPADSAEDYVREYAMIEKEVLRCRIEQLEEKMQKILEAAGGHGELKETEPRSTGSKGNDEGSKSGEDIAPEDSNVYSFYHDDEGKNGKCETWSDRDDTADDTRGEYSRMIDEEDSLRDAKTLLEDRPSIINLWKNFLDTLCENEQISLYGIADRFISVSATIKDAGEEGLQAVERQAWEELRILRESKSVDQLKAQRARTNAELYSKKDSKETRAHLVAQICRCLREEELLSDNAKEIVSKIIAWRATRKTIEGFGGALEAAEEMPILAKTRNNAERPKDVVEYMRKVDEYAINKLEAAAQAGAIDVEVSGGERIYLLLRQVEENIQKARNNKSRIRREGIEDITIGKVFSNEIREVAKSSKEGVLPEKVSREEVQRMIKLEVGFRLDKEKREKQRQNELGGKGWI